MTDSTISPSDRLRALFTRNRAGERVGVCSVCCAHPLVIRAALGAGRRRLVRQLFTEGAILALCGGIAGVGLAVLATRLLPLLSNDSRLVNVPINGSVLLFAVSATVFTCLLFGVLLAQFGAAALWFSAALALSALAALMVIHVPARAPEPNATPLEDTA